MSNHSKSDFLRQKEVERKNIAMEYFKLISAGRKAIGAQNTEPAFTVKHVLSDRNVVALHTELLNSKSKPSDGGLRQVHLFRFEGAKIAEYWDITQQVTPNMPNAN